MNVACWKCRASTSTRTTMEMNPLTWPQTSCGMALAALIGWNMMRLAEDPVRLFKSHIFVLKISTFFSPFFFRIFQNFWHVNRRIRNIQCRIPVDINWTAHQYPPLPHCEHGVPPSQERLPQSGQQLGRAQKWFPRNCTHLPIVRNMWNFSKYYTMIANFSKKVHIDTPNLSHRRLVWCFFVQALKVPGTSKGRVVTGCCLEKIGAADSSYPFRRMWLWWIKKINISILWKSTCNHSRQIFTSQKRHFALDICTEKPVSPSILGSVSWYIGTPWHIRHGTRLGGLGG